MYLTPHIYLVRLYQINKKSVQHKVGKNSNNEKQCLVKILQNIKEIEKIRSQCNNLYFYLKNREYSYLKNVIKNKIKRIDVGYESAEALGLLPDRSFGHASSGDYFLYNLLKSLSIKADDSIIDIGCGKGSALIIFSNFCFKKIAGVEISPTLLQIARENMERMNIKNASLFCRDAALFTKYDDYNYFYFFNPFPRSVMSEVIINIALSIKQKKRKARLIYKNPLCHETFIENGFLKKIEFQANRLPIFVYENAF